MTGATPIGTRTLVWQGALNARDIGGLRAGNGVIKVGALARSDGLARLTPVGAQALLEHGIRTVVDVRSLDEVARTRQDYPFGDGHAEVTYANVPFNSGYNGDDWDQVRASYVAAADRAELNRLDLDLHRAGITQIVAKIADAAAGGVVVHCHAGKDRTGMVVALILSLLGVSDSDIADDYALSGPNVEQLVVEWLDEMSDDPAERARLRALSEPSREVMLDSLAYLRRKYSSAESYLREGGLTDEQIARLEARLLYRG